MGDPTLNNLTVNSRNETRFKYSSVVNEPTAQLNPKLGPKKGNFELEKSFDKSSKYSK